MHNFTTSCNKGPVNVLFAAERPVNRRCLFIVKWESFVNYATKPQEKHPGIKAGLME